jgi:hypothetical protein
MTAIYHNGGECFNSTPRKAGFLLVRQRLCRFPNAPGSLVIISPTMLLLYHIFLKSESLPDGILLLKLLPTRHYTSNNENNDCRKAPHRVCPPPLFL